MICWQTLRGRKHGYWGKGPLTSWGKQSQGCSKDPRRCGTCRRCFCLKHLLSDESYRIALTRKTLKMTFCIYCTYFVAVWRPLFNRCICLYEDLRLFSARRNFPRAAQFFFVFFRLVQPESPQTKKNCAPRGNSAYTAKNAQVVQGWWKQHWTMLCCPHCSMLSTILFSIVEPESARNQVFPRA